MKKEIHILYLEDSAADALRLDDELSKSGLRFQSLRVDSREDFLRALEQEQPPDVILSDHGLPAFDGLMALGVAREKCPEVPFIFVTNALTRDMEIEKLTGGVADYVAKSRLGELPAAVQRALQEAEKRSRLKEHIDRLIRAGFWNRYLPICSSCKKIRDEHDQWRPPEEFFKEHLKITFSHGLCPDCMPKFFPE